MEEEHDSRSLQAGLAERLLAEVLRSPPLKEILILQMKGADPASAPGVARALMWEDPVVFMSIFGAVPDAVNWGAKFVLEVGEQLEGLPTPLLQDILSVIGSGIDPEPLARIPQVYGRLARRLLLEDEAAAERLVGLSIRAVNAALAGAEELTSLMELDRGRTVSALAEGLANLDAAAAGRVIRVVGRLARDAWKERRAAAVRGGKRAGASRTLLKGFAAAAALCVALRLRRFARK